MRIIGHDINYIFRLRVTQFKNRIYSGIYAFGLRSNPAKFPDL